MIVGIDAASFRDPEGFVFYHDNKVYRAITNPDAPILSTQYSEFFSTVVAQEFLVPFSHCEANPDEAGTSGAEGVAVDSQGNIYGAEVGPEDLKKYVKQQ